MSYIIDTETGTITETNPSPSMEMRYDQVYRQQGIRFFAKLADPKLFQIKDLEEIDLSVLHYFIPDNKTSFGIAEDNPFIKGKQHNQISYHMTDFSGNVKGPHKKRIFNYRLAIRAYHKQNHQVYWARELKKLNMYWTKRPWNIIIDYSMVGRNIEFRPNPMKHLFEFEAYYRTYLDGIRTHLKASARHQLMMFHIPDKLPTIPQIKLASKEMKRAYYPIFPDYKSLAFLDFWKWIDEGTRKQSILNEYLTERDLERVDLLFLYEGHVTLLNLGLLNRWLTGKEPLGDDSTDDEIQIDDDSAVSDSLGRRMQKRFYLFLSKIIAKQKEYAALNTEKDKDEAQSKEIEQIYAKNTDSTLKDDDIVDPDSVDQPAPSTAETTLIEEATTDEKTDQTKNPEEPTTDILPANATVVTKEEPLAQNAVPFQNVTTQVNIEPEDTLSPVNPLGNGSIISDIKVAQSQTSQLIDRKADEHLSNYVKDLAITTREADYWKKQLETYKRIKSPFNSKLSLEEYLNEPVEREIKDEDITIPDIKMATNKKALKSTLLTYDRHYIERSLRKDIVKNVMAVQRTGIAVTGYEIERKQDVASDFEIHVIQFTPIGGSPSTVRLKMPRVEPNGEIRSGSSTYKLKKLRRDKFLRKVNDNKVSMTSYYGKLFITRSSRKKFNLDDWLLRQVELKVHDKEYDNIIYGKADTHIQNLPMIVRPLISRYRQITLTKHKAILDFTHIEVKGDILLFGNAVTYDTKAQEWFLKGKNISEQDLFDIDLNEGPDQFAEVKILGEILPVGFILARQMGFSNMVSSLGLNPEKYEAGKQVPKESWQLVLRFADEKWIFDKRHMTLTQKFLINGMLNYARDLKQYSVYDFESKDVYGSILQANDVAIRYERELDLIQDLFIDDLSREMLVEQGLPTEMEPLWVKATELLTTSHFVDEINMDDMVISGYERIAGAMYRTLISQLRVFKSKAITSKRRFDVPPEDAWLMISRDPAMEIVDDINPLHNMKEKSVITFTGEGGRSRRSMVKRTRSYHQTDLGTISEGTVDSMDVAVTTYLSANPQFTSYLGNTKRLTDKQDDTAILSAVAMTAPFVTRDDRI